MNPIFQISIIIVLIIILYLLETRININVVKRKVQEKTDPLLLHQNFK